MSQEDSFEQTGGSAGLTPEVDAKGQAPAQAADHPGGGTPDGEQWQAHGNDAPSRGPEASDGMAEQRTHSPSEGGEVTAPDGEEVDPDISDGGQSGQDSGSMA